MRHFVGIEDLTPDRWESLYALFREIIAHPRDYADACRGSVMASLFFEPSTRTKQSFTAAMLRLGGGVFGFDDTSATSMAKGESLTDTIRVTSSYADVVVTRSPREGAAFAATLYSDVPVVNAGDGSRQHPTQTLADLATLAEVRGKIADITVGLCGDLRYGRTVYPLVAALSMFPGIRFVFIAPDGLTLSERVTRLARERGIAYAEAASLADALPSLDVLYMTRVQYERAADVPAVTDACTLTRDKLAAAKGDLTILHPLPRLGEIALDVDADPRACYFRQARYGMYIRMALLLTLTRLPRVAPAPPESHGEHTCRNANCVTRSDPYLPPLSDGGVCAYCEMPSQS